MGKLNITSLLKKASDLKQNMLYTQWAKSPKKQSVGVHF